MIYAFYIVTENDWTPRVLITLNTHFISQSALEVTTLEADVDELKVSF